MATVKALAEGDIHGLAELLQDEDADIASLARRRLTNLSPEFISFLHNLLAYPRDPNLQRDIRFILEDLRFARLEEAFREWIGKREPRHLEKGACLLSIFAYPDLSPELIPESLDGMADAVLKHCDGGVSPERNFAVLVEYLFREMGFRGNHESYYDPDNSYLNKVLERRVGIPISLSVVLLALAERLSLPLAGIGMPGHFLVRYDGKSTRFFVDAFNRGRVLTHEDCRKWLQNTGYGFQESYLARSTDEQILARMIRNIISIYSQDGRVREARILGDYLELCGTGGSISPS